MSESISPRLLETVQQKATADGSFGNSWRGYAIILRYLHEAYQRVPSLEAMPACDEDGIDYLFEAELEHLAQAVADIFPVTGLDEFSYYLSTPVKE
ncbi:MAG: hypothetical protein ACRDHW_07420 [Ktedonobacteraceae bacterium]